KPRLKMAANMVRRGSRVADIGTDHAYLPTALLLDGAIPCAIAADLRKGPLENAQATVTSYGIAEKVQLRRSDGLCNIQPDEVDDIVIAGMGGILISEILEAAPWVKNEKYKLILQPQSHDEIVRRWLWSNGFEIQEQEVCIDDKKPYICMSAIYTGKQTEHNPIEDMFGRFFYLEDDASDAFCRKKLKRVKVRLSAFQKIDPENEEIPALQYILDEVKKW
ncbi:MAG: SAM-dependent methyltransferase, partial [Clostridia bacterium]|nr:SAM-dependent methyltransferase [Clostridia bacterium]